MIITYLEMVKGEFTLRITELNSQITKIATMNEESITSVIGFAMPKNEDDQDDI